MNNPKTIIFAPLNWGLGHATRIIPIIRYYQKSGHKIIIAGYGRSFQLLQIEFQNENVEFIKLPGFNVAYSKKQNQTGKIFLQLPAFLFWKACEHVLTKRMIHKHHPDLIISDNRYGLWNKHCISVIVTHQLKIYMPTIIRWLEKPVQLVLKKWIEKFDYCWIPDNEGKMSLTQAMTNVKPMIRNARFIGLLSRFSSPEFETKIFENDVLVIISGPEPHRSIFYNSIIKELTGTKLRVIIICGIPESNEMDAIDNIKVLSHVNAKELERLILYSNVIVCRSGYSGVMDLIRLKKPAIIIPTPGQKEQEIIAEKMVNEYQYIKLNEVRNLNQAINNAIPYSVNTPDIIFFPKNFIDPLN